MPRTLAGLAVMVLVGCASAPVQHFYTLGSRFETPAASAPLPARIMITSITVPELVDRPQLVLRTGPNRVSVLDNERWAEPLKPAIARVLATDLASRLGVPGIAIPGERSIPDANVLVSIDITRFEAILNEAVRIDATWRVTNSTGGTPVTGSASIRENTGPKIEEAIAAHDRALGALSAQLAEAVRQAAGVTR